MTTMTVTFGDLSPRQREVASLLADGRNYQRIASLLGISIRTVEMHTYAIAAKLGNDEQQPRIRVIRWVQRNREAAA